MSVHLFVRLVPRDVRRLACCFLLLGAQAVMAQAQSTVAVPSAATPDYQALALKWARAEAAQYTSAEDAAHLRLEVTVGSLDSRLHLAPCSDVEVYVPPGSRLWGHSRIGLRCQEGSVKWNVSLPVTVKAFGPAWVIRGQVASGAPIGAGDVLETQVDWAEESSPVLQDSAQWMGQIATHMLLSGQVLRANMVKPAQVFQAGSEVRVVAQGPGFEVSSDAQALSAGVVGQTARVRMDNGRITSGTVLDARTVKIELL